MPDISDAEFVKKYGASKQDVLLHETGHALLHKWGMTGEISGPNYADLRKEIHRARKEFKQGAYMNDETGAKARHFNKSQ